MLENLFKFPIVMIDGQREEEKEKQSELLALQSDNVSMDIIIGEAECPYDDFLSISDRWMPTDESYERALNRKFDACSVIFMNAGTYVVPWNKEKFKRELDKFSKTVPLEKDENEYSVIKLSKEQFIESLKNDILSKDTEQQ